MTRTAGAALLLTLLLLAGANVAPAYPQFDTTDDVYDAMKGYEKLMPVYVPVKTVNVGRFDASTGSFAGLRTKVTFVPGDEPGRPERVETVPQVNTNAVHVIASFELAGNRSRTVTLTANGRVRRVPPGTQRLKVDVRRARALSWRLGVGRHHVQDQVRFKRPRVIGVGAFVVEALPIAVIYAPPQPADPAKHNTSTYTRSEEIGTRVQQKFTRGEQARTISTTPEYELDSGFARALRAQAGLIGLVVGDDENGKGVAAGLKAVAGALGSAERTTTEADVRERGTAMEIRLARETTCQASALLGPGDGDLIVFLNHARLVWRDDGRATRLSYLDARAIECPSVRVLKNALARRHQRPGACLEDDQTTTRSLRAAQRPQPWHGLSRATVRGLLSLDRFALCGPNATLTAARFQPCLPLVSSGDSVISTTYSTSVTEEDRHASTSTTIVADDISASFAAFVGIGPPQSERVETTQSLSSGTAFRRDQMVKTSVRVEGPPPATDQIEVFYDRLFGTFAYRAGNGFRRLLGTLPSPC